MQKIHQHPELFRKLIYEILKNSNIGRENVQGLSLIVDEILFANPLIIAFCLNLAPALIAINYLPKKSLKEKTKNRMKKKVAQEMVWESLVEVKSQKFHRESKSQEALNVNRFSFWEGAKIK